MSTKRRLRFSIGAMLVITAVVAVLLNYEIQRARAIETTVKRVGAWYGVVSFRPRANMPSFVAKFLPVYWTQEIDRIWIAIFSHEHLPPSYFRDSEEIAVIDSSDFENIVELGALDHLTEAVLCGSAINYNAVSRMCRSTQLEYCHFSDARLSEDEIAELKRLCPHGIVRAAKD